jgi:hypothetical protein
MLTVQRRSVGSEVVGAQLRRQRAQLVHTHLRHLDIYENGVPVRVAIVNYLDDPTGASTLHGVISIAGTTMPSRVKVKYLAATTVVQEGGFTWANQARYLCGCRGVSPTC